MKQESQTKTKRSYLFRRLLIQTSIAYNLTFDFYISIFVFVLTFKIHTSKISRYINTFIYAYK